MSGEHDENVNAGEPEVSDAAASRAKREFSTIQFPYGDLDDAVAFAKAVHEVGGQECLTEQLAGFLKVAPTGGAFRARMSYPRIFGLVEYDRGSVRLTELGLRIVDPQQEQAARVDAFLTVPLYRALYERYKGYALPPPAGLERELAVLGVSSKQTDKARQVFDRSAKQAGFFWAGSDRLTLPVTKSRPDARASSDTPQLPLPVENETKISDILKKNSEYTHHPFVEGLLNKLPPAETEWSSKDRIKWLRTAANIFDLMYQGGSGDIEIKLGTEE